MIYSKVARIIDPTQVVLAAGSADGVKAGMEFIIYELSDAVIDPETGEDLGRIEIVKGRVIAQHVQEKITTAATKSRRVERTIDPFGRMNPFLPVKVTETVQDELDIEGAVPVPHTSTVRVGDRVRTLAEVATLQRVGA